MSAMVGWLLKHKRIVWGVTLCGLAILCVFLFDSKRVYMTAKEPRPLIYCVSADGNGNVTNTHVVWQAGRGAGEVPSPLLDDGRLYLISDNGIATCLDAATGEPLWRHRLGGNFSASPVLAAGKIYAANEEGQIFVFEAGEEFNVLAVNDLREPTFATPVVCANRLYLRTTSSLYCIGEPQTKAPSTTVAMAQK